MTSFSEFCVYDAICSKWSCYLCTNCVGDDLNHAILWSFVCSHMLALLRTWTRMLIHVQTSTDCNFSACSNYSTILRTRLWGLLWASFMRWTQHNIGGFMSKWDHQTIWIQHHILWTLLFLVLLLSLLLLFMQSFISSIY